jgi:hypothetical protein
VGVPIQFAGTDLIINSPSVNTDVQLLGIRKHITQQINALVGDEVTNVPHHSHLILSGLVEAQAGYLAPGGSPSTTDIDVTNVSLDAFFLGPNDWTLGFIEMSYDNTLPATNSYRIYNSRVFINKAFITVGDFNKSPWYGTVGQFYVPFGTYSSVMVSDNLTKILARTKARALLVGMQQQGTNAFYGSGYIFRGDSRVHSVNKVDNGGLNFGYRFGDCYIKGDVGASVIASITDSAGMQLGNGFASFEQLHHRVPAYGVHGIFHVGDKLDVLGEFVSAVKDFNVNDMSYNGSGAKPWAFNTEAAYSFNILENRPSSIGIGYSATHQALSLGLPQSRYSAVFNTSLWRNTLESLEFRHDRNYAASSTANGPTGAATTPGQCTSVVCAGTGKSDNAITAQIDYYF